MNTTDLDLIDVLSPDECRRTREQVFALRPHWRRRREDVPFFTLGTASYLDAASQGFPAYRASARATNPILDQSFGWLYERLADVLSRQLGGPFELHDSLARPGFHIFLSDARFEMPASLHFDLQFEHIDWTEIGEVDGDRQLSFTLAITLPAKGGGLLLWNINNLQIRHLSEDEKKEVMRSNRNPVFHPYEVGRLAVHSGHQLHQIAPMKDMRPDDDRVTLQGHALPVNGGWILYW